MDIDSIFEKNFKLDNFFIVPRDLIDGTYPENFLADDELFYLLLMYAFRDTQHKDRAGLVTIGVKSFNQLIRPIQKKEFDKIQDSIYDKEFIFKLRNPVRYMHHGIALPPLYDWGNKKTVQRYPNVEFIRQNIDFYKINYIKVPIILIKDLRITPRNRSCRLDQRAIYLLLLLYRFNFLETYGGVDFSVFCKYKGKLKVDPIIFQYLHLDSDDDEESLYDSLEFLESTGFFQWTEVIVQQEQGVRGRKVFKSDLSKYKKPLTPDMEVIQVIRLFHQPYLMKEYVK